MQSVAVPCPRHTLTLGRATQTGQSFAAPVLPSVGGNEHAQAHIAFHFGAMYVLQIAQQVIAERSGEAVSLAP
jgi:hypothetical protein